MILSVQNVSKSFGTDEILKNVSFHIEDHEKAAVVGINGAGKSTLLNTITGLVHGSQGSIEFQGKNIFNMAPHKIVGMGISMSPEGREIFPALSVQENLRLGAYIRKDTAGIDSAYQRVYDLFPRLKERVNQSAGTLSGGEQQMLAIGRALMSDPQLLLLDEPSLGLAPNLVLLIFDLIKSINQQGTSILLIEQNANMALSIAHRAYVMETGTITLSGDAQQLKNDDKVRKAYLGGH